MLCGIAIYSGGGIAQASTGCSVSVDINPSVTPTKIEQELQPFVEPGPGDSIHIDTSRARSAGVSDEALDVAEALNELYWERDIGYWSWFDPSTWPRYGNWCGKGHSGPRGAD